MPDLKAIADAIVANNDFDAAIIVCPKGVAGTMTLAVKKKASQNDVNVFEGTEILWKDLAHVIASGGQPTIISRSMVDDIIATSKKADTDLKAALDVARRVVEAYRVIELLGTMKDAGLPGGKLKTGIDDLESFLKSAAEKPRT